MSSRLDARQLRLQDDLVILVLEDVHRRHPVAAAQHIVVAAVRVAEDAVDAVLHLGELTKRVESSDSHTHCSSFSFHEFDPATGSGFGLAGLQPASGRRLEPASLSQREPG